MASEQIICEVVGSLANSLYLNVQCKSVRWCNTPALYYFVERCSTHKNVSQNIEKFLYYYSKLFLVFLSGALTSFDLGSSLVYIAGAALVTEAHK